MYQLIQRVWPSCGMGTMIGSIREMEKVAGTPSTTRRSALASRLLSTQRLWSLGSEAPPGAATPPRFSTGPTPRVLGTQERPEMHTVMWKLPIFRYYQLVLKF